MIQLTFLDEKTGALITIHGGTIDEQWDIVGKIREDGAVGVIFSCSQTKHPVVQTEEELEINSGCIPIPYGFKIPKEKVAETI